MHVHEASLRTCCCESHPAPCALPGPQCAANCYFCGSAGAGKCNTDECDERYGPTKSGTCDPVRLLQAHGRCGLHVHEASVRTCCCESHHRLLCARYTAVRCPLPWLLDSRGWQVRYM